jgi:hypothetical protein
MKVGKMRKLLILLGVLVGLAGPARADFVLNGTPLVTSTTSSRRPSARTRSGSSQPPTAIRDLRPVVLEVVA